MASGWLSSRQSECRTPSPRSPRNPPLRALTSWWHTAGGQRLPWLGPPSPGGDEAWDSPSTVQNVPPARLPSHSEPDHTSHYEPDSDQDGGDRGAWGGW
jgi:hypothetical protein